MMSAPAREMTHEHDDHMMHEHEGS
jgi:hypothetical protein